MKLRGERMAPIALIARKNLRTTPEFAALQMPKPAVSGEAFIASGKAMADGATIHKDTFIEHGLPSTFLDDFKAVITSLDSSISDRAQNYNRRLSATKGLDEREKQGRLVLSVLDSLLEPALVDNDALTRGWQGARLIRRRPGPTTPSTTAATTPGTEASPARLLQQLQPLQPLRPSQRPNQCALWPVAGGPSWATGHSRTSRSPQWTPI
jgi:hypothetical protein